MQDSMLAGESKEIVFDHNEGKLSQNINVDTAELMRHCVSKTFTASTRIYAELLLLHRGAELVAKDVHEVEQARLFARIFGKERLHLLPENLLAIGRRQALEGDLGL